MLLAHKLLYYP